MTLEQLAFGVAGTALSLVMIFYTYRSIRNFRDIDEVSLALFFPHGQAQLALKLLLGGLLIYTAAMAAGSAGLAYEIQGLDLVSKLGAGIGLLSIIYFLRVMGDITKES